MKNFLNYFSILLLIAAIACSTKSSEIKDVASQSPEDKDLTTPELKENVVDDEWRTWDTVAYEELRSKLPTFDLSQDLSNKSLEELRILRNTIPARYGYLFMNADMRYYFYHQPWYKALMEARWYGDCEESGLKKAPPIVYSAEENAFVEKVKKLETEKLKQNYIISDGKKYANVKNIVNAWQYNNVPQELLTGLGKHGYAIVPAENVQLFHVYEQNDYSQTQNFVTTDLYLQLFHMHFSFMLRSLEENQFVPLIKELTSGMAMEAKKLNQETGDKLVKDASAYSIAFYSIPFMILSGKEEVPYATAYKSMALQEKKSIDAAAARPTDFLPAYKDFNFPYDLFKPRGHYTRNDTLKQYFKAMQWLQTAPYCLDDDKDLQRALVAAYLINTGKSTKGTSLKHLYKAILDPTTFLVGKPDNLSIMDVCDLLKQKNITGASDLFLPENISYFRQELKKIESIKNVIKPKKQNTCASKINFMPSRFVLDNEILQEMADPDDRPFPKGLDVLAAFGSKSAENILVGEEKEGRWDKFLPTLEKMKSKYSNYEHWDETVYAKWISGLNEMLKPDQRYPYFMQLPSWNKKNLNTALASWAELKHDAILYAEQPMAAECGGGEECSPPPEPYTIGYVEPNIHYWTEALELLTLTQNMLTDYGMFDEFRYKHDQLRDMCQFLLAVTNKELRGEKLLEQEYHTIERIGSSVEYITLSIFGTDTWNYVSGPDKEVAVVADVYTNNLGDKAGILHAAVGYANDLYVVVEVEGYLYITKGSTFSYYEFPKPLDERMTDEAWQEALKKRKVYPVPQWMNEVIIKLDKSLEPTVKEFLYSSGC
jgi:hypothetical protein